MWAGSSSPCMGGYLLCRVRSSRQRLRSCEKSNIKAVPRFKDHLKVLSHVTTHCNLVDVALGGMYWTCAHSTSPANLCYLTPTNRMGSCRARTLCVHSLTPFFPYLPIPCDQAIAPNNAGLDPVAIGYRLLEREPAYQPPHYWRTCHLTRYHA